MAVRVVVIDDDAGVCDSIKDLLSLDDLDCQVAETGEAGLAMVRAERPDLVITDVQLPDISGYQVCQMVKKDPNLSRVPVIMISGRFTEPDDRLQGFDLGADEYFAKPFNPVLFMARLKSILRGPRLAT